MHVYTDRHYGRPTRKSISLPHLFLLRGLSSNSLSIPHDYLRAGQLFRCPTAYQTSRFSAAHSGISPGHRIVRSFHETCAQDKTLRAQLAAPAFRIAAPLRHTHVSFSLSVVP